MQNITMYIGDNASGKTRLLKKIINDAKSKNKEVVTNIKGLGLEAYALDKEKFNIIKDIPNSLVDNIIIDKNINNTHAAVLNKLLTYIYAQGDILVLDELDSTLSSQEILNISMIISEIKHKWEHIYVNGYSEKLLRMFNTIDYENDIENYETNVFYVKDNMETIHIEEGDILEYIDAIRG